MTTFESLQGADSDFMVVLLGGFGLFWGSALLSVPRASQRLVAFLALHGGMVRRTAVAGSLWPDASERHAHSNLRQALARLQSTARKALAAIQQLEQVTLLREHAPAGAIQHGIAAVEAQSATLMGRLVWDVSGQRDHAAAGRYYEQAIHAAAGTKAGWGRSLPAPVPRLPDHLRPQATGGCGTRSRRAVGDTACGRPHGGRKDKDEDNRYPPHLHHLLSSSLCGSLDQP
jgi:hypothetical protein